MRKNKIILIAILVLAFFLRVWGLDRVPPELFGDELDVGYHAYSLLKTGRDYYGQFLPTYIHSFSEWRAPLLMYVTVPFVAIFGLNEWGVRLPSAVFGVVSVWLMYLVVQETKFKERLEDRSQKLEIIVALLLAISPWHLQYSRAAFEVSLLLTLLLLGVYLFLKSFKINYLLFFAAFIFSLTFYTYSTANVFTPAFLTLLFFVFKNEVLKINKKILFSSLTLFVIVSLPIAYNILFGRAAERYSQFSVFTNSEIVAEINAKRNEVNDTLIERIAHNRPVFWTKKIISSYATAFSPQFLFISGDVTYRHSIHSVGEFYWTMLPLMLLGIFALLSRPSKEKFFWLGWLLIAPIPASLTRDGSVHATRLILMLPPLTTISALGVKRLFEINVKPLVRKSIVTLLSLFLILEFGFYLHEYWVHYAKESWLWWHTGYKESLSYMKDNEGDYDILVFNNTYEPTLIRFLFWWEYSPAEFLQEFTGDKATKNILPGFNGFKLTEKYYFGTSREFPTGVIGFVKPGMMYLVSQRDEVGGDWDWEKNSPSEIKVLRTVRNPYGEPIFYVVAGK